MFRRNKKAPGDPGHIVPNTQGTSNEISFSVLHNMRNAAAEGGEPQRPAWEFPQEEVKQRRRARRRGRRLMVAGITVAVLAVVALAATVLVVNVQNQLDHVARMRSTLSQVIGACEELAPFNDAVRAAVAQPMGTTPFADMEAAYDAALPGVPEQTGRLEDLRAQLEELQEHLQAPGDREAAHQGIAAANAQLNLLDMGKQMMDAALPAQEAYAQAEAAMAHILKADQLDDEATAAAQELNAENAKASRDKSQQAAQELEQAQNALQAVQQQAGALVPKAGDGAQANMDALTGYAAYVQTRLDAQRAAAASMQAYLDRDKAALQAQNDRYNQLEQQAADQIAQLPQAPAASFAALYEAASAGSADQWSAEEARAQAALEAVRSYLA